MALKRRRRDGSIEYVTFEDKDEKIKRLESLVKELTDLLTELTGYNPEVAPIDSYQMYG